MTARLYVAPASAASACAGAALELAGVAFERHEPVASLVRGLPLPLLETGEGPIGGARAILEHLDRQSARTLLSAGSAAESWGETVFEPAAARITWAAIRRHPRALKSYLAAAGPAERAAARAGRGALIVGRVRALGAGDMTVRADMHALPEQLDRIDGWLDEGVLGGPDPSAADLWVACSLRLLQTIGDVRPLIEARPCAALARRLCPSFPGAVPSRVLPDYWLPVLAAA